MAKVLLVGKSTVIIQMGVTQAQIKHAKRVKPSALHLKNEEDLTSIIFSVDEGTSTTLQDAGAIICDKNDFVKSYDKPMTKEKAIELHGLAVDRLNKVEAQILAANELAFDVEVEELEASDVEA